MRIEYTLEEIFSFTGPNLCFLGDQNDFKMLAIVILELTNHGNNISFNLLELDFFRNSKIDKDIIFSSKPGANCLGVIENEKLIFELDNVYWLRLFKYFVLMSWNQGTYYLNTGDSTFSDLDLEQDINFICSAGFPQFGVQTEALLPLQMR